MASVIDISVSEKGCFQTYLFTYLYLIILLNLCIFRWLFPFIGHMGIATSAGVIRDFAGPYFVSVSAYSFFYTIYSFYIICFYRNITGIRNLHFTIFYIYITLNVPKNRIILTHCFKQITTNLKILSKELVIGCM